MTRSIPLHPVVDDSLAGLPEAAHAWARANGFRGQRGRLLPLPAADGSLAGYGFGIGPEEGRSPLVFGLAAAALEPGQYHLSSVPGDPTLAALGFVLGAYRFDRYLPKKPRAVLELPLGADAAELARLSDATILARDLINTPTSDLGPVALEAAVRAVATRYGASATSIVGDDLLARNFPMIHAVGRAAAEAPRLVDFTWGRADAPRVTLVGKGVTFDTGGLDIKPSSSMLLMKKDMGGSANILGLAAALMDRKLDIRLRVLIPIVENAISASAFRPGDVLTSRKGISVEIGNTDAEGRLILADALALADEEAPEVMIDMATLTGAARTALGPELPPLYATDDHLAAGLIDSGLAVDDPLWRMPLHRPYASMISSKIADINNAGASGFAGSITAALFLSRFVEQSRSWAHLDIFAWAPEARAGRPFGGTDQGLRAAYGYLVRRFG